MLKSVIATVTHQIMPRDRRWPRDHTIYEDMQVLRDRSD